MSKLAVRQQVVQSETLAKNDIINHPSESEGQDRATTKRVLVDTDAGTDDAWAIFMVLFAHKNIKNPIKIEGITCVHGNTNVDNVIVNVTRLLKTVNVTDIPVYRGAESPFTIDFVEDPPYNGEDGFGDANLPPLSPVIQKKHAVNVIIKSLIENPGELCILALGPLTNLALAIRMNPKIYNLPKEIIILGGNYEGYGTSSPAAEFNFLSDAESARTVLENFTCPMTVIPFETWWNCSLPYTFRVDILGKIDTPQIDLLNKIEAKILQNNKMNWVVPDEIAAAVLIDPSVVIKKEKFYCTVELQGSFTRAMMVVDRLSVLGKQPNVTVIEKINKNILKELLLQAANGKTRIRNENIMKI